MQPLATVLPPQSLTTPTTQDPVFGSPVGRFLLDPDASNHLAIHAVSEFVLRWWGLVFTVMTCALGFVALVLAARHLQQRRLGSSGRTVELLLPPRVDPDGAQTWWDQLHALP